LRWSDGCGVLGFGWVSVAGFSCAGRFAEGVVLLVFFVVWGGFMFVLVGDVLVWEVWACFVVWEVCVRWIGSGWVGRVSVLVGFWWWLLWVWWLRCGICVWFAFGLFGLFDWLCWGVSVVCSRAGGFRRVR